MADQVARVAVIDDDPEFSALMQTVLEEEGYEYVALASVETDPVGALRSGQVDAAILDLRGVGDGSLSLLRRIRGQLTDLPILVCSADIEQLRDHASALAAMPAVATLEKPFRIEHLAGALERLLAGVVPLAVDIGRPDRTAVAALETLLGKVGRSLHWGVTDAWVPDARPGLLRCAAAWATSESLRPFVRVSRRMRLPVGAGLPGRIWSSGRAAWIEDLGGDMNFPRRSTARRVGLVSAAAVPVLDGDQMVGVVAGYATRSRRADAAALERLRAAVAWTPQLLRRAAGVRSED